MMVPAQPLDKQFFPLLITRAMSCLTPSVALIGTEDQQQSYGEGCCRERQPIFHSIGVFPEVWKPMLGLHSQVQMSLSQNHSTFQGGKSLAKGKGHAGERLQQSIRGLPCAGLDHFLSFGIQEMIALKAEKGMANLTCPSFL